MSKRNKAYRCGNMILTNMTSTEVKKLDKIMNPVLRPVRPSISLSEYIEKYNPNVKRWTSKNGTDMVAAEVLHNVLDESADTIEQPEHYADRKMLYLKMAEE